MQLAEELFSRFMSELPEQLQEIQRQAMERNWSRLMASAHRLHGATAICGVPALNHLLEQLESAARDMVPEDTDRLVNAVSSESAKLLSETAASHNGIAVD